MMRARCASTVRGLSPRSRAIILFVPPASSPSSTSRSRGGNAAMSPSRARWPDPARLARGYSPEPRRAHREADQADKAHRGNRPLPPSSPGPRPQHPRGPHRSQSPAGPHAALSALFGTVSPPASGAECRAPHRRAPALAPPPGRIAPRRTSSPRSRPPEAEGTALVVRPRCYPPHRPWSRRAG